MSRKLLLSPSELWKGCCHLVSYPTVWIVLPFITVPRFLKGEIVAEEDRPVEVDLNHKGTEKFLLAVTMGFAIEKSEEVGM